MTTPDAPQQTAPGNAAANPPGTAKPAARDTAGGKPQNPAAAEEAEHMTREIAESGKYQAPGTSYGRGDSYGQGKYGQGITGFVPPAGPAGLSDAPTAPSEAPTAPSGEPTAPSGEPTAPSGEPDEFTVDIGQGRHGQPRGQISSDFGQYGMHDNNAHADPIVGVEPGAEPGVDAGKAAPRADAGKRAR
jgi:hypothetical protein